LWSGENLIHLALRGAQVIGLDISPELIELARQRTKAYNVTARLIVGSVMQQAVRWRLLLENPGREGIYLATSFLPPGDSHGE
jgi:tRNA/tmRNA/rRNA uracil-C5-methylase (TrmA/RlmC/RlmD family)